MLTSDKTTYQKIAADLKGRIVQGHVESGAFLPTERELQQHFSASRGTVRRALAHLVQAGFAENIPNRGVVAVKKSEVPTSIGNVALIEYGSYVLRYMGLRLSNRLREENLYLVNLGGSIDYPPEYAFQNALDNNFTGAIVWPYRSFTDNSFVEKASKHFPVVALDHQLEGTKTDLVTVDHEGAAFDATMQLIKQGCKRILVTGELDGLDITHARFRGYMKALFAGGLQPNAADYVFIHTSGQKDIDTTLLRHRLTSGAQVDGVLALQDYYIAQIVETVLFAGFDVPRQIKISTIGDDVEVTVYKFGLTAVGFDWDQMADAAVSLLLDRLANPNQPYKTISIPHRLIIRGLCGAPKSEWTEAEGSGLFSDQRQLPKARYHYSSRLGVPVDA